MHREILTSCLPLLGLMLLATVLLVVVACFSGARLRFSRLLCLHRSEKGGVQSLSFVLTLPLFMMILMFIVQLSQLTIARVVVERAAYATARSAMVWIPANLGETGAYPEQENRIGPYLHWLRTDAGPDATAYDVYAVVPSGRKFEKLHFAASMACMSICPSRDLEMTDEHPSQRDAARSLLKAYHAYAPASKRNGRLPARLANKLAYALDNTHVRVEIHHRSTEPPLMRHNVGPYANEFTPNEAGWQDQIVVTVHHDFALLPGPGRILARLASARTGTRRRESDRVSSDPVSRRITTPRGIYVYQISAKARLNNEGEKPLLPYIQPWKGAAGYARLPYERELDVVESYSWQDEEEYLSEEEEYYWRPADSF